MKKIKPFSQAIIETSRLILRPIQLSDAKDMFYNWASDAEVTKHLSWSPHRNLEETLAIISSWITKYEDPFFFLWIICLKDGRKSNLPKRRSKPAIGTISLFKLDHENLSAESGYCSSRYIWNQGYMSEALQAILDYSFRDNHFERIYARHLIENPASERVMIKAGMEYMERIEVDEHKENQSGILNKYEITRKKWENDQK